jgi:hypothetical protein
MKNNGEKPSATIRRSMTLDGVVFMSLADAKRLGEENTYRVVRRS